MTSYINKIWNIFSQWLTQTHIYVNKICFQVFPLLPRSNNKLSDQLAFTIKSQTVCTKPEPRIVEGIIVALWWFEVARCLIDTDTYTYMNANGNEQHEDR